MKEVAFAPEWKLSLQLEHRWEVGSTSPSVSISAPFWLQNKTGMLLDYKGGFGAGGATSDNIHERYFGRGTTQVICDKS